MSEWKPIDTAPKDNIPILGYDDGIMTVVIWHGYWGLTVVGSYANDNEWTPTHWMPLPDPPMSNKGDC